MVVPIKFRTGGEAIATSLAFNDIAIGRGLLTLFLVGSENGGAVLSPDAIYSDPNYIIDSSNTDHNFDVTINKPLLVDGDAILELCLGGKRTDAGTVAIVFDITLFHFDGSTETTLGTNQYTLSTKSLNAGAYEYFRTCSIFSITNQLWKVGDIVRVAIDTSNITGTERGLIVFCSLNEAISKAAGTDETSSPSIDRISRIRLPVKADI